jgi:hypothetical protein
MLFMALRGIDGDVGLFSATFPDSQRNPPWSEAAKIPDRGSLAGPAMAVFQDQLFMAWRGILSPEGDSDRRLFYAINDGTGWSPQTPLSDRASNYGPALATFRDKLYMAWRGSSDDQRLFWATFPEPTRNPPWSEQHPLDDRGSRAGPSLAVLGDQLFMAWRGVEGDQKTLFWSTFDGQSWSDQHPLPGRASLDGPSLAVLGRRLHMFWRGGFGIDESDQRVFFSFFQGGTGENAWSPPQLIQTPSGVLASSSRPGVAAFINRLFIASVGSATSVIIGNPDPGGDPIHVGAGPPDFRIFYTTFDGANASFPTFTNIGTSLQPALCVFTKVTNSLRQYLNGFDLSNGIRSIVPGVSSVRSMMGL